MPAVISDTVLVLAESFGRDLDAGRVASALGRGLQAEGRLRCDLCPLEDPLHAGREAGAAALLDALDFDARMRAARAIMVAAARLDDRTLAGSVAFEAATRARQAGVPAYAVTARNRLDPFEARIVDLQMVLEADSSRALSAAGRKLAAVI
jgi:glycerate kinase